MTLPPAHLSAPTPPRVCAVVVTYNRLELLQAAVAALRAQTSRLETILVVDNGCTDGTGRWLAEEVGQDSSGQLRVVTQTNLGNSGGVYTGLKTAFAEGYDWFWCLDDDTIPTPSALERLLAGAEGFREAPPDARLGWLNSVVLWSDGSLHRMNEPKLKPYLAWGPDVLARRCLPAQWCSFVSVLVAREAIATCGLPLKDMFIWYDDVEFTGRIALRGFAGLVVLDSFVEHRTKANYATDVEDLGAQNRARFRYAFRNEVLTLRTLHEGRPRKIAITFVRMMLRRVRLMLKAGKFRYLPMAMTEGFKGLTMDRRIEFPAAPALSSLSSVVTQPAESAHAVAPLSLK